MQIARAKLRLLELQEDTSPTRAHLRNSLAAFTRAAWPVIEPNTELVWSWHLDVVCEHLEDLFWGRAPDTIINIPPGTSKSTLSCVMFPAWAWLHRPSARFLCASYAQSLATRDNLRCRNIITSEWYHDTFRPDWALRGDQNTKTYFENTATGWRQATSVGGGSVGLRGDFTIIDDPHNVKRGGLSDVELQGVRVWHDESWSRRLNSMTAGRRLVIMQRLHVNDLSGHLLARGTWNHLCLPAEFEPERACVTHRGRVDPRTEPGELLDPIRLPRTVLDGERIVMGEATYAGQYQQRPVPTTGGLFRWQRVGIIEAAPTRFRSLVRYWDKAGTEGGGAFTAGVLMGRTPHGTYVILDVVRGRWGPLDRERAILATARADGPQVEIWVEQEPGSGGKESAEQTIRMLAGFVARAERVTGDKVTRARPFAAQVEAANVCLVHGPWNAAFLDELKTFPLGSYKDQIDAAAGAFNKLALQGTDPGEYMTGGAQSIAAGYDLY